MALKKSFRTYRDEGSNSEVSTLGHGQGCPSKMLENYLGPLHRRYDVLDYVGLCLPVEVEIAEHLHEGCVTFYLKTV